MATKKKGTLTTSGEWAKHLRKYHKRKFWKGERKEAKQFANISPKDAPHPGEILVELYLKPLRVKKEQLSTELEISEKDVTKLLEGKIRLTSTLAKRLGKMFNTSKEYWLGLQLSYEQTQNSVNPIKTQKEYKEVMKSIEAFLELAKEKGGFQELSRYEADTLAKLSKIAEDYEDQRLQIMPMKKVRR
jgi:antitoxin HigA-1